ncbi:MAG TPA: flagellar assembly peptidoglycan hydrolase FlgJ, partial [Pseudomonadales bacterium]|nr:flagellar assembly peptidoglycan hydrolase FlgJ [Pseudomonadales bacterium]
MVSSTRALESTTAYTDVQGLTALRGKSTGAQSAETLNKVAHQFESVFMNMVMKSMRDANNVFSKDNPFESQQSQFYQEMYDNQLSLSLSKKNGFGIADMIIKQMSKYVSGMDEENKKQAEDVRRLPNVLPKYKNGTVSGSVSLPATHDDALASLRETVLKDVSLNDTERLYLEEPLNVEEEDKSAPATHTTVDSFENSEEFVRTLYPIAKQAANEIGVDPKVLLAQAALETGWGKHVISDANGKSSYNLFNIKANDNWIGDKVAVDTLEYK